MASGPISYRARRIEPLVGPSLDGGYVTVVGDRIVAVGMRPVGAVRDLGDVLLLPGLVNAHVHLDLSVDSSPIAAGASFSSWLRAVVQRRRASDPKLVERSIRVQLDALGAAGTTCMGDIAAAELGHSLLSASGLGGVSFREVIGRRPERYEPLWKEAVGSLDKADSSVRSGISPHAPYSTAPEVYRRCRALPPARDVCTHWLESPEEVEYLRTGTGPLRDFLEEMGALDDASEPLGDPWAWLCEPSAGPAPTLVHCNYLQPRDVDRLAELAAQGRLRGVVYCPRTHAHFGHPPHPWLQLRRRGVSIGLGTDSLASNPDLLVHREGSYLFARDRGGDPAAILRMLTLEGAACLGLGSEIGSLEAGKRADFSAYRECKSVEDFLSVESPDCLGAARAGRWSEREFRTD